MSCINQEWLSACNQLFKFFFFFLCFSQFFTTTSLQAQLCSKKQSYSLLQFKLQFSFNKFASFDSCNDFGIPSYPKMESWKEGSDCCSWDGVQCNNVTGEVIGLDLSCSWLEGTIHPNSTLFYHFSHLRSLNLAFNDFRMSPISSSFGRFTKLTYFDLSGSHFSGKVPIELSFFTKLVTLFLWGNHDLRMDRPIFEALVHNLTRIREFDLGDVKISSKVPNSLLNLTSLTALHLDNCGLHGIFPDGIFHLPLLNTLYIIDNHALTGYFPQFLNSSNPQLQYLSLEYTSFSGELPYSIGNLKFLKVLYASNCKFYGSVPTSLWNLTQLNSLDLANNTFTGVLPSSLPNFTNLSFIDVSNNHLTGSLPSQAAGFPSLKYLYISNNLIDSKIPAWLFSLPTIDILDLSNNKLIGNLNEFKSTSLQIIDLSSNNLCGTVPSSTFELASLIYLILSSNNFVGNIPEPTNFSKNLTVLDLKKNNFSGSIVDSFPKGNSLVTLNFNANGFQGPIPKSLLNCKRLEVLDIGSNKFYDKFPHWLGNLPNLHVLVLQSNKFNGPISTSKVKHPFPNLRVIDLSNNNFTGPLPKEYFISFKAMMNVDEANVKLQYMGNNSYSATYYHDSLSMVIKGSPVEMERVLTYLIVIDLSRNNIEGEIPAIIGRLNSVRGLNLSSNNLTGHIPRSLENLKKLEWLDLSSNKLVGKIPQELTNLTFLSVLNLSCNQLTGPIPQGLQFNTFPNESYRDNHGLCGPPLSKKCNNFGGNQMPPLAPQHEVNLQSTCGFDWGVIISGYGFGMVFGLVVGYLMFSSGKLEWLVEFIEENCQRNVRRN